MYVSCCPLYPIKSNTSDTRQQGQLPQSSPRALEAGDSVSSSHVRSQSLLSHSAMPAPQLPAP